MFKISDSIFQTPDPVWHETHKFPAEPHIEAHDESGEEYAHERTFSFRERIILKSGSMLIRLGNGLVGKVNKHTTEPQVI